MNGGQPARRARAPRGARRVAACALAALLASAGCGPDAPPPARPQLVLLVNTDLPVPRFGDTLLVEWIDAAGRVLDRRARALPNAGDWPASFGVLRRADGRPARFRVRLHPAAQVRTVGPGVTALDAGVGDGGGGDASGAATEPIPEHTIDRLIEVSPPAEGGVRYAEVLLTGECLGVVADLTHDTGCVAEDDGAGRTRARLDAPASAGVYSPQTGDAGRSASRVGSWQGAARVPCAGSPRAPTEGRDLDDDEACVPGGVFFLGDARAAGGYCATCNAVERLVRVSPFYMDRHEVSIERWGAALRAGFAPPAGSWIPWSMGSAQGAQDCTYENLGNRPVAHAPMTCVSWEAAQAFCAWDGHRRLPTEAEWEFAAAGGSDERLFAWGDEPAPSCDLAVYGRDQGVVQPSAPGTYRECIEQGISVAPVGSLPYGDRSRDELLDLAGNVAEWTADVFEQYGRGCWAGAGLVRDPRCTTGPDPTLRAVRGGAWDDTSTWLLAGRRRSYRSAQATQLGGTAAFIGSHVGFRCVRDGGAP